MKTFLRLLAAACVLISAAAYAQTDILQVIPEKSLAAVVAKNADVAETHFRDMAGRLTGDLPEESFVEQLLQLTKLRAEGAEPPKESAIDLKAPMAVVLVLPAPDVKGMPLGVVVKAADYKKLLDELAKAVGAAGVEVTPDGTDMLKGERVTLFAVPMGQFAVVADAEYVVRSIKGDSEKNLAVSGFDALKEAVVLSDAAIYVNLDDVVKTYGEAINAMKQEALNQIKNAPAGADGAMTPEKTAKLMEAEFDLLIKCASQVDALSYGFNFGAEGARVSTHVQPVANTTLARLTAMVKPAPQTLLNSFDAPLLLAAGWNLDPALVKECGGLLREFLDKSGLLEAKEGQGDIFESYQKVLDAMSGPGAMMMAPPDDGAGLVRLVYVVGLKPNVNIREDLRAHLQKSFGMMDAFQGPVKIKSQIEADAEKHRDISIDRVTITFEANPDAPRPQGGPSPNDIIGMIYGPKMVVYLAQVQDKLVYTAGYEASGALKTQIDKLLDGKVGTLTGSPAWQSATKGLAPAPAGTLVVGYAELMRAFAARIFTMLDPDIAAAIGQVNFDKPSGVGCSVASAPKGIVIHLNVPMQEMENIKALFMEIEAAVKQKNQPPAEPAPAPAPDEGAPPGP